MKSVMMMAGCACVAFTAGLVQAQVWKPDKNVEIIVNTAPGSGQDTTARTIQKILQDRKLVESSTSVVNKPGGGGVLSYGYLNQHPRDAHFVAISSSSLLTNHIMGRAQITYTDLTPLAVLFGEYISVAVRADSPIKNGREVIERLKKDPAALSIGVATSIGNANHQGAAVAMKVSSIDIKKLRTVVFQSGSAAVTAMLGGHIDVVPGSVGLMLPYVQSGQVRLIAIASPQRLTGALANAPTWREQGANAVVSNWRGLIGPRGMNDAQIAYWDNTLRALTESEEWKKDLEKNNWSNDYMKSTETRKYMEADYAQLKSFLVDIDLAK